jgi:hypothetical protein
VEVLSASLVDYRQAVSLPARQYERVGRLLATAVTDAEREDIPVGDALA